MADPVEIPQNWAADSGAGAGDGPPPPPFPPPPPPPAGGDGVQPPAGGGEDNDEDDDDDTPSLVSDSLVSELVDLDAKFAKKKKTVHFSLEISFTSVKSTFIRSNAVQKPHLEEFGARAWPVHFFAIKTPVSRPSLIGI